MSRSTSSPHSVVAEAILEGANRRPSQEDFALVGMIALNHTGLEYQIESFVWRYMKDTDLGHIATSRMGIMEIVDTLATLVEWTEPEDHVAEAISVALSHFNTLRLKRNTIIHGFNFIADKRAGKLFIERRTKSIVFDDFLTYEISNSVLKTVEAEQFKLGNFLFQLGRQIGRRGEEAIGHDKPPPSERTPLPPIPREPERLIPLPHEAPKSARSQRRASQESEAHERKLAQKARQRAVTKSRSQD